MLCESLAASLDVEALAFSDLITRLLAQGLKDWDSVRPLAVNPFAVDAMAFESELFSCRVFRLTCKFKTNMFDVNKLCFAVGPKLGFFLTGLAVAVTFSDLAAVGSFRIKNYVDRVRIFNFGLNSFS